MSTSDIPQPIRGALGATSVGPRNIELDRQNPDLLASPDTDSGSIPNLKFSFSLAHNRLLEGGWAREVTVRELPVSTTMAGVNMRLAPAPFANCIGIKKPNGPISSKGRSASRWSMPIGMCSSTTCGPAIFGSCPRGFPIPSRGSATEPSFCSCSTMVLFPKTKHC